MAGYCLPALHGKDVVGSSEGAPQGASPRATSLTRLKRRGGTSLGTSQAGPAYARGSTAEELPGEFNARSRVYLTAIDASVLGSLARIPHARASRDARDPPLKNRF